MSEIIFWRVMVLGIGTDGCCRVCWSMRCCAFLSLDVIVDTFFWIVVFLV